MKIKFIAVGKTSGDFMQAGLKMYLERLNHYIPVEFIEVVPKGFSSEKRASALLLEEARLVRARLRPGDELVLLDPAGKAQTSEGFAAWLEDRFNRMTKSLVFVAGGPFGFDESLRREARTMLSLSPMTFTHQLVRIVFMEQVYRAMKIIRNEPYHH